MQARLEKLNPIVSLVETIGSPKVLDTLNAIQNHASAAEIARKLDSFDLTQDGVRFKQNKELIVQGQIKLLDVTGKERIRLHDDGQQAIVSLFSTAQHRRSTPFSAMDAVSIRITKFTPGPSPKSPSRVGQALSATILEGVDMSAGQEKHNRKSLNLKAEGAPIRQFEGRIGMSWINPSFRSSWTEKRKTKNSS